MISLWMTLTVTYRSNKENEQILFYFSFITRAPEQAGNFFLQISLHNYGGINRLDVTSGKVLFFILNISFGVDNQRSIRINPPHAPER